MSILRSSRLYLCYCLIWCLMLWLLVVGGQVQGSRLCVRDEGRCSSSYRGLYYRRHSLVCYTEPIRYIYVELQVLTAGNLQIEVFQRVMYILTRSKFWRRLLRSSSELKSQSTKLHRIIHCIFLF